MERRIAQLKDENCHIVETRTGEALIVLFLGRFQWMKIFRNLPAAVHAAIRLQLMESTDDVTISQFQGVRGRWCTVPQDFDADVLLIAGFSFLRAPEAGPPKKTAT